MSTFGTIAVTAVVTAFVCLVAANFLTAEKRLRRRPKRLYGSEGADFRRAIGVLLGPQVLAGNRVETLINGDRIFPPMLEAIEGAERTLCFETFIYWSGEIGQRFADALSAAARRGVRVHILLDWVGSRRMDGTLLEQIREAGAEIEVYHKPSWYHLGRLNNRTHRKLLIVDGRIGFTGGVGIAEQWTGDAQDADHWRDNHYRVEGPVVAQMQAVFIDNWIKANGRVLHGEEYFPKLERAGTMDAQMFGSSPSGGSDSLHLMFLLAITAARKSIDIANSYFVPDTLTLAALVDAAKRGVRVRIVIPAGRNTDAFIVHRASQAHWNRLLNAGVEIWKFKPTMLHCKVMVVDGHWTTVGSANFDSRSFRLNDEANLNVFDEALAQEQLTQIEADIARSEKVTLRQWRRRSPGQRLFELTFALLRSQL